jgi:DNA-directed RNA polymerase specialized sigma24 family protein
VNSLDHAFHTTRWTLVGKAAGGSLEAKEALSELCAAYYAPVVAFLCRTGHGQDAASELAHEFFAQLLANAALGDPDRQRGRFRSYLLGSVKHFVANTRRAALREKRGGGAEHLPLKEGSDTSPGIDPADANGFPPDSAFDREWALALVERALALLGSECEGAEQTAQFTMLRPWLSPAAAPGPVAEVAAQLGLSEGAAKVAIHRLRRRFREIVRAEIAQTLHSASELDDEMRHLIAALSG